MNVSVVSIVVTVAVRVHHGFVLVLVFMAGREQEVETCRDAGRLIAALDMDVAIGISLYPADAGDPQALERNADAARSRARQLGRRQYRFYPG